MNFTPHKYQQHAIEAVESREEVGLFLDMGLGLARPSSP